MFALAHYRSVLAFSCVALSFGAYGAENVALTDVPDYAWHAGCFGTATGNLMAYWDRHGLSDFYTGPTGNGVAPLNSYGANASIHSLWASQAGLDGRPANKPGHIDDYWEQFQSQSSFESTAEDPYVIAQRPEHEPDCLGDFMGQSQNKWSDLGGECAGNINGYAFNFWDPEGGKRTNFKPADLGSIPVRDIQSGLKEWTQFRGYDADVTSQLADFRMSNGKGFTFDDLRAEINAGYPVLLILQNPNQLSRSLPGNPRSNPSAHAMVAYGYLVTDAGDNYVRYRTSWASGETFHRWTPDNWEAELPLRGLITFHPTPRITQLKHQDGAFNLSWEGPSSTLNDQSAGDTRNTHWYVVERSSDLASKKFTAVGEPTTNLNTLIADGPEARGFYRVRTLSSAELEQRQGANN